MNKDKNELYQNLIQKKERGEKLNLEGVSSKDLEYLYCDMMVSEIAELFDTTESKVRYKLKKYGINLKKISALKFLENFFNKPEVLTKLNNEAKERVYRIENINKISKAVTHFAFRNGPVEDMHADGKLTQSDMKTLNKFMVNRLAYIFGLIINGQWAEFEFLVEHIDKLYGHNWDLAEPDDGGMRKLLKAMITKDWSELNSWICHFE